MSEAGDIAGKIIYVTVAIFILSYIVSIYPSAFAGFPVDTMTTALLLLIPTGAFFLWSQWKSSF
jgi:uncharacterized membrane protein